MLLGVGCHLAKMMEKRKQALALKNESVDSYVCLFFKENKKKHRL